MGNCCCSDRHSNKSANLKRLGDQMDKVIFILGTTGVGKSKLAMDLAKRLDGEIINADSMQIYSGNLKGAMTARPTREDLEEVNHHLYGCIEMQEEGSVTFNVNKYRDMAIEAIQDVLSRGKYPIVCGGTTYYIESLLFEDQAQKERSEFDHEKFCMSFDNKICELQSKLGDDFKRFEALTESFRVNIPLDKKQVIEDNFESTLCHELLEVLDPKMGDYFHKNDKRKIVNCLFKDLKACEGSGTTMS